MTASSCNRVRFCSIYERENMKYSLSMHNPNPPLAADNTEDDPDLEPDAVHYPDLTFDELGDTGAQQERVLDKVE